MSGDYERSYTQVEESKVRDKVAMSTVLKAKFCNGSTIVYLANRWKVIEKLLFYNNELIKSPPILAKCL